MATQAPTPSSPHDVRPRRGGALAACVGLLLLHVALTLFTYPPVALFGDEPLGAPSVYAAYGRVTATLEALAQPGARWWSAAWTYDPRALAGYASGLPLDMDVKAHALGTLLLTRLGLAAPAAYNLVGALAALAGPPLVWLAARALLRPGGPRESTTRAELISLALATFVWHLDSTARLFGVAGPTPLFAAASALCVYTLVAWHRALVDEDAPRRAAIA
ncbi:MAG: hypothetical protein KC468_04600, partial [Myxococcales bacterium]|nr:hypothetical protein [Myxococcales bacterium]